MRKKVAGSLKKQRKKHFFIGAITFPNSRNPNEALHAKSLLLGRTTRLVESRHNKNSLSKHCEIKVRD